MKQIKLRRINSKRYCLNCKENVKLVMVGLEGYCPNEVSFVDGRYINKLYTIDTRDKKGKK